MAFDLEQFHQAFFEECVEHLDNMEQALLRLDSAEDNAETINTIFRGAHSIKGGAATFGFQEVAGFTHVMETLLDRMRDGSWCIVREDVDLLLGSIDCVRQMLTARRDGAPLDTAYGDDLKQRLEAALDRPRLIPPAPPPAVAAASPLTGSGDEITEEEFEHLLDELHGKGQSPGAHPSVAGDITEEEFEALLDRLHGPGRAPVGPSVKEVDWRIDFKPSHKMLRHGNDPIRIFNELERLGRIEVTADAASLPTFADMDPEGCYLRWTIGLAGGERGAIEEVFAWVEGESDLAVEDRRERASPAAIGSTLPPPRTDASPATAAEPRATSVASPGVSRPSAASPALSAGGDAASIRVAIDKIDAIINLVGELVITQSMLNELSENFDMNRLPRLLDGLSQLARNSRELQESVMRVRMIPISFAFSRFPRLVRDLSTRLGKKVELKMTGEQTELDKTVMERIGDPLVHLVRNALDHGIEAPAVRASRGKPETGTLHLNAYHQSGHIVIEIADDGAGLNKERILRKARERGLIKDDAAVPDEKIHDLIFLPGFSTAEKVSDVSGRGVGMDVVRKNIRALGGNVEMRSEEGLGTTIVIRLPLTLAILDGQTVRVGEQTYIVPLVSIVESIQVRPTTVNIVAGKAEIIRLRDEHLPIVRLHEVFNILPRTTRLDEGLLVVVEGEGLKAGLFVDELLGQQQVVIKSLEANYRPVEGVAGATILGDGTVSLILDVPGLIRLARMRDGEVQPAVNAATRAA